MYVSDGMDSDFRGNGLKNLQGQNNLYHIPQLLASGFEIFHASDFAAVVTGRRFSPFAHQLQTHTPTD